MRKTTIILRDSKKFMDEITALHDEMDKAGLGGVALRLYFDGWADVTQAQARSSRQASVVCGRGENCGCEMSNESIERLALAVVFGLVAAGLGLFVRAIVITVGA